MKHTFGQTITHWFFPGFQTFRCKQTRRSALRFSIAHHHELTLAAHLLHRDNVGVIAFNGIYGIFADAQSRTAYKRILAIKNRPNERNLVLVVAPEYLHEEVDFSRAHYSQEQVIALQRSVHALGVILPAGRKAPLHLIVTQEDQQQTILSIWTEYPPLRRLLELFREHGGRSLVGTSANRSGHPTHYETHAAWQDFNADVDFFLEDDFTALPEIRRRSTSILDLTHPRPRLHRLGNVSKEEIQEALLKYNFPDLFVDTQKVILVRQQA